jgi:hypothetical protein
MISVFNLTKRGTHDVNHLLASLMLTWQEPAKDEGNN